jgi:hypothetical protein
MDSSRASWPTPQSYTFLDGSLLHVLGASAGHLPPWATSTDLCEHCPSGGILAVCPHGSLNCGRKFVSPFHILSSLPQPSLCVGMRLSLLTHATHVATLTEDVLADADVHTCSHTYRLLTSPLWRMSAQVLCPQGELLNN